MESGQFDSENITKSSEVCRALAEYVIHWYKWQVVRQRLYKMQRVYDLNEPRPEPRPAPSIHQRDTFSYR